MKGEQLRPLNLAILCGLLSCSGAVDRTPPRQDVGLPQAPVFPDELMDFDAGKPLSLVQVNLPVPEGCRLQPGVQVDRQVMDCALRVETNMPEQWKRAGDLPIWIFGDHSVTQTWSKSGDRWLLIRSIHQSKGDHASEDSSSGTESSSGPQ